MAEISRGVSGDGGNSGNGGADNGGRLRSEIEALGSQIDDQPTVEASVSVGARASGSDGGHVREGGHSGERRTLEERGSTSLIVGLEGP